MENNEKKSESIEQLPFNADPVKEQRFSAFWSLFIKDYEPMRNQNVRFLNKGGVSRNILDYVRDSVDRMNEFHLKPDYKEDWQNNVFDPTTRSKVVSILSKLASSRIKPNLLLKPLTLQDIKAVEIKKKVFSDLLEAANIHNDDDNQVIWEMYTGMSEGTVIGYEDWEKGEIKKDIVTDINPDTGETKTKEMAVDCWDDVYGEIVPLDEFYPETIWVNSSKFKRKIKRAFWVSELSYAGFMDSYSKYPSAKDVSPAGTHFGQEGFDWGISKSINTSNVQLVKWFDARKGKYGIWANGVELYWGAMPWNHGELPFWISVAEPIHHQFLYGKSFPDKLMGNQDTSNALLNGMLDQLFIGLNSPIFVSGDTQGLDEGFLEPGRVYEIGDGAKVETPKLGGVDPSSFQMFSLLKKSMEESSISAQAQGVASGGRKTKYEVQLLQEGALDLASLFLQIAEMASRKKYWMRMYNILQYYSMPSTSANGKPKYKLITIDDQPLMNGRVGRKMIQITGGMNEQLNRGDLKKLAGTEDVLKADKEVVMITRNELVNRNFDMEMQIVPNASIKDSELMKKKNDITFYQSTVGNPMFNQAMTAKDFARAFDKPDEIVNDKPETQENVQMQNEGVGQQGGQQGSQQPPTDMLTE